MALNSLYCADVPLSNYSLTHSEEWQEIWDCCADNKLRSIKPTVGGYKRKTASLSRHDCVLINRLRIGHTRLTHSLILISFLPYRYNYLLYSIHCF